MKYKNGLKEAIIPVHLSVPLTEHPGLALGSYVTSTPAQGMTREWILASLGMSGFAVWTANLGHLFRRAALGVSFWCLAPGDLWEGSYFGFSATSNR